jgi:peptidyl-prolyl cis-trans isomerase C
MRFLPLTAAIAVTALSTAALAPMAQAQATKGAKAAAAPAATGGNAVVATVNGDPIRLSDVAAAANQVSPEIQQQMPKDVLYSRLIDQLVNRKAIAIQAHKSALDKKPEIQHAMAAAADQVLVNAYLQQQVLPAVNEEAIKAAYDKQYAGKPGEPEVHARHILVDTEAKAKDVITQLQGGAKFEDLVKKYSDPKDPATQAGGDLGFFKKGDMLPEFADASFKLKPNEFTTTPVHTRYGWHVIQTLETRTSQPPTYDQAHDQIKQGLVQAGLQKTVADAKAAVKIVVFNSDGTVVKPGASPTLPAAPAAPAPAKK